MKHPHLPRSPRAPQAPQAPELKSPLLCSLLLVAVGCFLSACTTSSADTNPTPEPLGKSVPNAEPDAGLNSEAAPDSATDLSTDPSTDRERWQATGRLIIHVGKTGRLARLGHNHIVSSESLVGEAWITNDSALRAEVRVAVEDLAVDQPQMRAEFRADWPGTYDSTPTAKNIAGTRANMLGPKVLDAAQHPLISARLTAADAWPEFSAANAGSLSATLALEVRGNATSIPVTLNWQRISDNQIDWLCNFEITHSDLGLTPFSALGGALAVAEDLKLEVGGQLQR